MIEYADLRDGLIRGSIVCEAQGAAAGSLEENATWKTLGRERTRHAKAGRMEVRIGYKIFGSST